MHKLALESQKGHKVSTANIDRPPISSLPTCYVLMTNMFSLD